MAFYEDGFMWPQEATPYDYVSFSGYEPYGLDNYGEPIVSQVQDPFGANYVHSSYSWANPDISYYAYNYAEPGLFALESAPCETGYISYHTNYSISYSQMNSGFNEPEFEEYDPTPYGGGYDVVSTYGKPLPPSDKTCYPRSNQKPIEPTEPIGPISTPIPLVKAKPEPEHVPVVLPQPTPVPGPVSPIESEGLELTEVEEIENDGYNYPSYPGYGYDYPWPEYENGNRVDVGYDYGYGKQTVQIPPFEYDPDVVDLCENIFGSWPCLARIRTQQMSIDNNKPPVTCPEIRHRNRLEECASYFFGRPVAFYNQYRRDHGYV